MVHHETMRDDDSEYSEDEAALIMAATQRFSAAGRGGGEFKTPDTPKQSLRTVSSGLSVCSEGRAQRRHSSLGSGRERNPLLSPNSKPQRRRATRRCSIATSDYSEDPTASDGGRRAPAIVIRPQRRQSIGNGNYKFQGNLPAKLRRDSNGSTSSGSLAGQGSRPPVSSSCGSSLAKPSPLSLRNRSFGRSSSMISLISLDSVAEQHTEQHFDMDVDGSSVIDWERASDCDSSFSNSVSSRRRSSTRARRRRSSFGADSLNGAVQAVEYDRTRLKGPSSDNGTGRRASMMV